MTITTSIRPHQEILGPGSIVDFGPAEVDLGRTIPTLLSTFGTAEAEIAAAVFVFALSSFGNTWRSIGGSEIDACIDKARATSPGQVSNGVDIQRFGNVAASSLYRSLAFSGLRYLIAGEFIAIDPFPSSGSGDDSDPRLAPSRSFYLVLKADREAWEKTGAPMSPNERRTLLDTLRPPIVTRGQ